MTFLVIGAGAIGQRHANNLAALGETADLFSWRSGGLSGMERKLADTRYEGAFICTATQIRLPVIARLAQAGIPFYVEKPLAYTRAGLEEITRTLGDLADRCFVGLMMRYHPALRFLHALERDPVYRFHFEIGHDVHQWRQNWRFADSYAARPDGGGVLLDLCHELDMAHCLFPDATPGAVLSLSGPGHPEVDFATTVTLSGDHVQGSVSMDYLSPVSHRNIALRGTDTCYDFDLAANRFSQRNGTTEVLHDLAIDRQLMFQNAMADFLRLVRGKPVQNPLAPVLAKTLASSTLICQAYEMREFTGQTGGAL
jgi:predicted dehydrogenase